MWKWLINFLLVLTPFVAFAQKDTTKLSFKKYYTPTGIRIGTDVVSLVRNYYDESFTGWEANVDVDFYRYYLTVDYGTWGRSYQREDGTYYSNDGNYYRVGVDVNFLTRDPQRNMFFLGARYASSTFNEQYYYIEENYTNLYENIDMPAHWFELTTGVRVKMWKFIWLGYTARFKFALSTDNSRDMIPHDVPGYGRTDKDSYWGFNYQILFKIPVRKAPPIPQKKKKKK